MSQNKIIELQALKKSLKMTYTEISQKSGLPLSTVQKVLGGKIKNPRIATLTAIENAMKSTSLNNNKITSASNIFDTNRLDLDINESSPAPQISIGNQDFATIIENGYFYVDKTLFIKKWWESADVVTLITRPRRFGKTLNLSMLDCFFSNKYHNSDQLFKNLSIWHYPQFHNLCNNYPVLFISFASVKGTNYQTARAQIIQEIITLYRNNDHVRNADFLTDMDKLFWSKINYEMTDAIATDSIRFLCEILSKYYNQKVIILLDEYDTPIHEAYTDGFWSEMTGFIRNLFNATLKTNPYLERALLTGITRISKESIFSDLNNLKVDTITNARFDKDFGFTESEVRNALLSYGLSNTFEDVKKWYDGFTIGKCTEIYNPWSVTQYLDERTLGNYWANTSENSLVEKLIREGSIDVKKSMESLLKGDTIEVLIDDEIVFNLIDKSESGIFSMLLASGYLRINSYILQSGVRKKCNVSLTNLEVLHTFEDMIKRWFENDNIRYNDFIKALLMNNVKYMNRFMNEVALNTFSVFDTGGRSSEYEPERFYHGFILGLMVDLSDRYYITSNRESGFGRYDVCLEPKEKDAPAYVLEFKVHDPDEEQNLEATVQKALDQIKEKKYDAGLISRGINKDNIHHYGFAFQGKKVLIG